jgi:hypothetical protein
VLQPGSALTCMCAFVPPFPLLKHCALQAASFSEAGHQRLMAACTLCNMFPMAVPAAGWQQPLPCRPPIWTSITILRYTCCISFLLCHLAYPIFLLLHQDARL